MTGAGRGFVSLGLQAVSGGELLTGGLCDVTLDPGDPAPPGSRPLPHAPPGMDEAGIKSVNMDDSCCGVPPVLEGCWSSDPD